MISPYFGHFYVLTALNTIYNLFMIIAMDFVLWELTDSKIRFLEVTLSGLFITDVSSYLESLK